MLFGEKSLLLTQELESYVENHTESLENRAYVDREEVGISRMYISRIIVRLDNVLELVVPFQEKDYEVILHSGIDRAIVSAIKREIDTIDEVSNFEHALSPEAYRDEKDLANEELLEWVRMDVTKLNQIVEKLEQY